MVRVSQMRGAQAGGGVVQIESEGIPRQVIGKCLNPKRADLAARLTGLLSGAASGHAAFEGTFMVQGHVRYATAGASTESEAHPFHFIEPRERGARRVARVGFAGLPQTQRPVETALSHNGDMDALVFRGVRLPYPVLSGFLERVLATKNRWQGDSPTLAGSIELFLTQGMWLESLRLAHQLVAAPPPPEVSLASLPAPGKTRARALSRAFARHPAPDPDVLAFWAEVAEEAWSAARGAQLAEGGLVREHASAELLARLRQHAFPELPTECLASFARATVDAFLDNDLYHAVRALEPLIEGTFGCVVTSSLEPGRCVAFARGQPLSIGFDDEHSSVAVVSERAALKVQTELGAPAFGERLDLDLCDGEVAQIEVVAGRPATLVVYNVAARRELTRAELGLYGRIVALVDNPYVTPAPAEARDRAARDIEDIVPVLQSVRRTFERAGSNNAETARAFADALFLRRHPRLLVVGITNDLWLAEQFARNVRTLFPEIQAEAKSSNSVLKEVDQQPLDENSVVLVVSQSGQDFPTLGSLLLLKHRLAAHSNDSIFVLSSELDTLMGQFAGQSYAKDAPFCGRIFSNQSGFRPSEAATLSVNATQLTFVEILLFLANHALNTRHFPRPPHGCELARHELDVLRRRRDATVDRHAPAVTSKQTAAQTSAIAQQLRTQARRWTRHVLEGVVAFLAAIVVLELNLQFRAGLEPARALSLLPKLGTEHWLARSLHVVGTQANVLFYAFLVPLIVWILRSLQSRRAMHRQGVRELLIGDTRYVHSIVWFLARKLFSLSYGFASIKPYSADCQDDLVLTHEPVRGTLGLFGIPDGRRRHLGVRAAAATMTAKQFGNSRSLGGSGAEVVTIGHGPAERVEGCEAHLALPSGLPESSSAKLDLLVEDMFDSWDRLLAMQMFVSALAEGVASFGPFRYDRSRTKDQVFAPTTAAPVSAAAVFALFARKLSPFTPRLVSGPAGTVRMRPTASEAWWRTGTTLIGMPAPERQPATSGEDRRVA
jgi:hypothetical protein